MAEKQVMLNGQSVTVKELTVSDVRNWVAEQEAGASVDPLRSMVFDDCSLDDLARMADIEAIALESMTFADLETLRTTCKALNPHFFRVRAALLRVARQLEAEVESMTLTARSS